MRTLPQSAAAPHESVRGSRAALYLYRAADGVVDCGATAPGGPHRRGGSGDAAGSTVAAAPPLDAALHVALFLRQALQSILQFSGRGLRHHPRRLRNRHHFMVCLGRSVGRSGGAGAPAPAAAATVGEWFVTCRAQ